MNPEIEIEGESVLVIGGGGISRAIGEMFVHQRATGKIQAPEGEGFGVRRRSTVHGRQRNSSGDRASRSGRTSETRNG